MAIRVLTRTAFHHLITSMDKPIPKLLHSKPNFSSAVFIHSTSVPSSYFQHKNLNQLSNLFQRYGFPSSDLHNFLTKNPFLLHSNASDIKGSLKILQSMCSCKDFVVSMVFGCPRILELEFLKKWEMGIPQLGISDGNSLMILNILEVSRKFDLYPDDLSRCIRILRGFGFSCDTVTRVLEEFPMVVMMQEERIRSRINFLLGIGIRRDRIDRIVRLFPAVLAFGVENKLNPLLAEFESLGFSLDEIKKEIIRDPRVLGLEVGELSKCLRMLKSLKCRVPIKEEIFHEGAFRAGYAVKLRIDCLRKHGLISRDAFGVLWREPRVILYDVEEIEKKIEFLVNRMKVDIIWLTEVPEYLGVHFNKQIVPRYNVIEYLRSINGIGDEVGLKSLVKLSRLKFYNLYVKPYPECEKMYGRFAGDTKLRSQHPVGMWKLFKPPKYPESKEDLKNIKSFMEQLR